MICSSPDGEAILDQCTRSSVVRKICPSKWCGHNVSLPRHLFELRPVVIFAAFHEACQPDLVVADAVFKLHGAAGAKAVVQGPKGKRSVPVEQFCTGPGRNVLQNGEMLVSLSFPAPAAHSGAAFQRFICFVPDSDELPTVKYRRARIYYETNHFEEAALIFRDLAMNHRDSDVAEYAANLYLDCLNILGTHSAPARQ